MRWHPQPAGGKGPGAHALWGLPHQLSLVGAMPGPGTQMLQALFDGPCRMSAHAVNAVKKVNFAEAGALPQLSGVSGGMDLPTDELHLAKHHGLDCRIELGNRYGAFTQEDIEVEDPRIVVQLQDAIKMQSLNLVRKERRKKLC